MLAVLLFADFRQYAYSLMCQCFGIPPEHCHAYLELVKDRGMCVFHEAPYSKCYDGPWDNVDLSIGWAAAMYVYTGDVRFRKKLKKLKNRDRHAILRTAHRNFIYLTYHITQAHQTRGGV